LTKLVKEPISACFLELRVSK